MQYQLYGYPIWLVTSSLSHSYLYGYPIWFNYTCIACVAYPLPISIIMNWCFKWLKVQQVVVWLHALCEHLTEFLSGGGIKAPKLCLSWHFCCVHATQEMKMSHCKLLIVLNTLLLCIEMVSIRSGQWVAKCVHSQSNGLANNSMVHMYLHILTSALHNYVLVIIM